MHRRPTSIASSRARFLLFILTASFLVPLAPPARAEETQPDPAATASPPSTATAPAAVTPAATDSPPAPPAASPPAAPPPPDPAAPTNDAHVKFGPTTGLRFDSDTAHLELHTFNWFRAQTDSRVGAATRPQAQVPLARLVLQGSVFDPRVFFFFQPEFAQGSAGQLLDLFGEWHFDPKLALRIGQFRTPFSRAYITPLSNLELTERGLVSDEFRFGRDTGAMAFGDLAAGFFHYEVGVFNGANIDDFAGDRIAPMGMARTEFRFGTPIPYDQAPSLTLVDPHGLTLAFGGAFARRGITQKDGATNVTSTENVTSATAELTWMHGPWTIHSETFWRGAESSPRPTNSFGAFVQTGVFVVPRQIEIGGRAGWLTNGPDVESYEAFIADYWKTDKITFGHHLKTTLDYRYDSGDRPSFGTVGGTTKNDLRDRHRVILQAQIFF
jgi:hypothetical protein